MRQVLEVHKQFHSSNIASAAFSCSRRCGSTSCGSSILLLAAETSEVIHANLIPSQTKMQVGVLGMFPLILAVAENSFVLRNIGSCHFRIVQSHHHQRSWWEKSQECYFSRKPTSFEGLSWSKATVFQFPYQEPCAKPDLVLHASIIVWNSTMIFFTLATIFGRALRHLLLLQFQVNTVAFLQTLIKLFLGNFPGEVKPKCNTAPQLLDHIVSWCILTLFCNRCNCVLKQPEFSKDNSGNPGEPGEVSQH